MSNVSVTHKLRASTEGQNFPPVMDDNKVIVRAGMFLYQMPYSVGWLKPRQSIFKLIIQDDWINVMKRNGKMPNYGFNHRLTVDMLADLNGIAILALRIISPWQKLTK